MRERSAFIINGLLGVFILLILLAATGISLFMEEFIFAGIFLLIAITIGSGITLVQPNQSIVVIFFGKYMGSIRKEGLVFTVPFSIRRTISLRVRNFNSNQLKVNDVKGNPIEIAAVIVYKVVDSAKAVFDVDDYSKFVNIQSEAAIRAVATRDRKSTRLNSSHVANSYAVFCLKKNSRLPVVAGGCPHANACLDCTHFCTSKQLLPQHEEQLERTEELLAIDKDKQGHRRVETNSRVKERLEQIIGSLTG